MTSKWTYKRKRDPDGKVVRYKARLVARGFDQVEGIHFTSRYAPVARLATVRVMLALAAQYGLVARQYDVVAAYTYGTLETPVYMRPPQGTTANGLVCKLNKALYGLPQAAKAWYDTLAKELITLGFEAIPGDSGTFIRREKDDFTILVVYVDDILALGTSDKIMGTIIDRLSAKFDITDAGPVSQLLGVKIERPNPETVMLSQRRHVEELLERFGMTDCNPVRSPLDPNVKLVDLSADTETTPEATERFRELVGGLMYLSGTRPDLAYPVSALSQWLNKPTAAHMSAAKRVLRYLKGTAHYKLEYRRDPSGLRAYSDTSWSSGTPDTKSFGGYALIMGGAAVTWSSRK